MIYLVDLAQVLSTGRVIKESRKGKLNRLDQAMVAGGSIVETGIFPYVVAHLKYTYYLSQRIAVLFV